MITHFQSIPQSPTEQAYISLQLKYDRLIEEKSLLVKEIEEVKARQTPQTHEFVALREKYDQLVLGQTLMVTQHQGE